MKFRDLALTAGLLQAAVLAACIIPVYTDSGDWFDRDRPAFSRTIPFAPGGSIRIENAFGNIILIGWDREEVEILAEETWDDGAGLGAAGRRTSAAVPRVDIETGDDSLTITARTRDEAFAGDRVVHLMIRIPHHTVLKGVTGGRGRISVSDVYGEALLRLEDGDIRVENYSGSLDAEILRGEIQAEMLDLRTEDSVRLVSGQGPISLFLEPAFAGRLEADAPAGSVVCDFDLDPPAGRSRASGKIGTGEGALVTVSARDGSVTVRKFSG